MTTPGRIRVLIVDDSQPLAEAFADALAAHEDIQVLGTACNGADGVRLVESLHPDVVLMDFQMPVMDGVKATMKVRKLAPSTKVLMMTAYDDASLIDQAMEAGADGYLLKGTLVADTVEAIREAMRRGSRPAEASWRRR